MARILVIDDDDDIRNVLLLMLKASGHEVITAVNGAEGLKAFNTQPADVVLTDLLLPDQDGLEIIKQLRRISPKVGIIAMSGESGANTVLAAAERAGVGILAKPFFPDQLLAAVDNALLQSQHV